MDKNALSKKRIFSFAVISGAAASIFMQPFQVIKTSYQVSTGNMVYTENISMKSVASRMLKAEGIGAFYRGYFPAGPKIALSSGIYLSLIRQFKNMLPHQLQGSAGNLLSAGVARAIQAVLLNPFMVIATRLEVMGFNYYHNTIDAGIKILRYEGAKTFFTKGLGLILLKDVPFSSLHYPIYEFFKKTIKRAKLIPSAMREQQWLVCACSSVLACLVSCVATTPIDVIRTRMVFQHYNDNPTQHYSSLRDACRKIIYYDGPFGFFRGFQSRFIKKSLGVMLAWTLFETLVTY